MDQDVNINEFDEWRIQLRRMINRISRVLIDFSEFKLITDVRQRSDEKDTVQWMMLCAK
jgi:hypothetical protein